MATYHIICAFIIRYPCIIFLLMLSRIFVNIEAHEYTNKIAYLADQEAYQGLQQQTETFRDNSNISFPLPVDLSNSDTFAIVGAESGWSAWGGWAACSRSCGGGVARQLRACAAPDGCRGEPVRYDICNVQPCTVSRSPAAQYEWERAVQCARHGGRGRWRPHENRAAPCALTCRRTSLREQRHLTQNVSDEADSGEMVAVLAERVTDGTRCRRDSLDMCIDGRCQRVGCDWRMGSRARADACGVCGGDGRSCRYRWGRAPAAPCSASCGGGYKVSMAVCRERETGSAVADALCAAARRPPPALRLCSTRPCPHEWSLGEWSECSTSCGGGVRRRTVRCGAAGGAVDGASGCTGPRPRATVSCALEACDGDAGGWSVGPWSGCSVSCGRGVQTRGVRCARADACDPPARSPTTRTCFSGVECLTRHMAHQNEVDDRMLADLVLLSQPTVQAYAPRGPRAEKLIAEQAVPSEATFITDNEWGPCSVTCGEGHRRREVHCKIFLEFSRTIARLPDNKCTGHKPAEETERCLMEPCSMAYGSSYGDSFLPDPAFSSDTYRSPNYGDSSIRVAPGSPGKSYSWKEKGYTSCSASCLSGVQELIIQCVRDEDQKNASPYMCDPLTKPENRIRTCNDHPCPPRWNYTEFSPCTKSCGIGIQTREVNCIHEVTRGGANTVVVPNSMCPQPPPPDRQYCNVLDCPVKWHTTEWSKCSKTCGGGVKERKVECKQTMAQSHIVERPISLCSSSKPSATKPCNSKPCVLDTSSPDIDMTDTSYIQHDPKKKKVTLKIGASATLFYGTQVKIKCPVKRYNRTRILWAKDHTYISKSRKYKMSKKGALRIQELTYKDTGLYTCVAGRSTANLTLIVKPRPGEFLSSEEIERQKANPLDDPNGGKDRNDGRYHAIISGVEEDQSHEQRPDSANRRKQQQKVNKAEKTKESGTSRTVTTPKQLLKYNEEENVENYEENEESTVSLHNSGKINHNVVYATSSGTRLVPNLQVIHYLLQLFVNLGSKPSSVMTAYNIAQNGAKIEIEKITACSNETCRNFSFLKTSDKINQLNIINETHKESVLKVTENSIETNTSLMNHSDNSPRSQQQHNNIVQYSWIFSNWSTCSHSCGNNGFQMRGIRCVLHHTNRTEDVETKFCEDNDKPPSNMRKCSLDLCPYWTTGEWSPCMKNRCFDWNTATQRRDIECVASNKTKLSTLYCDPLMRPPHRQECYNLLCKGAWKTENWSECHSPCPVTSVQASTQMDTRQPGVRYRILRCVWANTQRPAGEACASLPRPPVSAACTPPPCRDIPKDNTTCQDRSKFCENVRYLSMCKIRRYKEQCCKTCEN